MFNHIENSGDGNVFNQTVSGSDTIYDLTPVDLAKEYLWREESLKNARKKKFWNSLLLLILALIFVFVGLLILFYSGAFSSLEKFWQLLKDVSLEMIFSGLSLIVGAIFSGEFYRKVSNPDRDVERQRDGLRLIEERVFDLHVSKSEWKSMLKEAKGGVVNG